MNYKTVNGQCARRSCDQLIMGRNLSYMRALQIILSEEYLEEVDIDVIRRIFYKSGKYRLNRVKRQLSCTCTLQCGCTIADCSTNCVDNDIMNICPPCLNQSSMVQQSVISNILAQDISSVDDLAVPLTGAASVAGTLGLVSLLFQRPPPLFVPGSAPIGVPAPGTTGGCLLPTDGSPDVLEGLALVPDGLTAVAVCPQSINQRIPAISVIFSEDISVRKRYSFVSFKHNL